MTAATRTGSEMNNVAIRIDTRYYETCSLDA